MQLNIHAMYFSPTGTTEKTTSTIAASLAVKGKRPYRKYYMPKIAGRPAICPFLRMLKAVR